MTNAEKYLKDNVSVEEFIEALTYELSGWDNKTYSYGMEDTIRNALNKPITPTLTEDERVILRNINEEKIGRLENGNLYISYGMHNKYIPFFNHLFQFIKVRRRI